MHMHMLRLLLSSKWVFWAASEAACIAILEVLACFICGKEGDRMLRETVTKGQKETTDFHY